MKVEMFESDLVALRAWFLAEMYWVLRNFRGSATSWVRSDVHNAGVGGDPASLHLMGLGLDVVFDTVVDRNRAVIFAESRGMHCLVEWDHVHFQPLPRKSGVSAARELPATSRGESLEPSGAQSGLFRSVAGVEVVASPLPEPEGGMKPPDGA